jgi:hypothetical protein
MDIKKFQKVFTDILKNNNQYITLMIDRVIMNDLKN